MKRFYVYLLTNLVNGKYYVGQTSRALSERWSCHKSHARNRNNNGMWNTPLGRAIRKHGEDSFAAELLSEAGSRKEVDNLERLWIVLLDSRKNTLGYNCRSGGDVNSGWKHTPEALQKIKAASTGRRYSPETREKLATLARNRVWSKESREKLAAANRGKTASEETRKRMSAARLGRKLSPEHRAKVSAARIKFEANRIEV